jgi:hypothetical protein
MLNTYLYVKKFCRIFQNKQFLCQKIKEYFFYYISVYFLGGRCSLPNIPLDKILNANRNMSRYRFHLEIVPGLKLYAMLDSTEGRQFIKLGLFGRTFPLAEIYWEGIKGVAHIIRTDKWLRVRGEPFIDEVRKLCELLSTEQNVQVREEEDFWVLEYNLQQSPLQDSLRAFFASVFGEKRNAHQERMLTLAMKSSSTFRGVQRIKISRESHLINSLDIEAKWEGGQRKAYIEILPLEVPIPKPPDQALRETLPEVSFGMLVFQMMSIGGWSNHGSLTQRVLEQIINFESNKPTKDQLYSEIYDSGWYSDSYTVADERAGLTPKLGTHHPIVVGAANEDSTGSLKPEYDNWFSDDDQFKANPAFYYSQSGYKRYYHHFGGDGIGLEDKWYFVFEGPPPTTVGNRFYSARDWAYGYGRINEDLNRLTFTRAVQQYHLYTKKSKRLAYLIMGHVLHLLEDVGEPDHAALEDHAGSGMNEVDAYKTYGYCHFLATEAALVAAASCGMFYAICFAAAFGIAEAACWASASSDVLGYEKLIKDKWDMSQINTSINDKGILKKDTYDDYFHDLAQIAKTKVSELGLDYALGCDTLLLIPPIPNADPSIDSTNQAECQPYFDLTNAIVPEIIGMSAGLLAHFYDIVNYPPFLEQVQIVQFEPGAQPIRFGVLRENAPLHCTRYKAHWEDTGKLSRTLKVDKNQPLALDYPAYIFLLFGPSNVYPEHSKCMRHVELRLTGVLPATGDPINTVVKLEEAEDPTLGPYYWGTFTVSNCANDPYTIFLKVSGKDHGPHDTHRNPSGADLDMDPSNFPRADYTQPNFPWLNYLPGIDEHHKVQVPVPVWDVEITPPSPFIVSRKPIGHLPDTHKTKLRVKQLSWDCNWEPFEGSPTCSTQWDLDPNVHWLGPSGLTKTAPFGVFNFNVELIPDPRGRFVTVRVTVNPASKLGKYQLTVICHFGTFMKKIALNFEIQ